MTKQSEAIKKAEEELNRKLTPIERMQYAAPGKRLGSADDEDWKIVEKETHEGIALKKAFDESVQQSELVHNLQMRHTAVLGFNTAKRALLRDFRAGKLARIKPSPKAE